ncbi:MAG: trigger factor [Patescibacteria group bacterium]|nr:trigger factor [Patescibacteria group bacterium]
MNLSTKKLPKNLLEINIEMSPEEMKEFYDKALEDLAKGLKIDGFRPGKAPANLVKQSIDEAKILEQAAEEAMNRKYAEVIEKEKINPAGPPTVEIKKLAPDNPFVFKLTVPLIPKVKLGNYKKIKFQQKKIEIPPKDLEATIKKLQQSRAAETLVSREAQTGDRVEIDLNLFLDKVPLENGQVKNLSIILGEDYYIPGLSKNLEGLKSGETKEFSLKYPANHYDKKLAGKDIEFKSKVNNIFQIDLPKLDDEFSKLFGFQTFVDLEKQVQDTLEKEAKSKEEQRQELEILKQLAEKGDYEEIPEILIEHEFEKMIAEFTMSLQEEGFGQGGEGDIFHKYLESIQKTEEEFKKGLLPKAEDRIKVSLAIRQIAILENIEVNDQDVEEEIEKLSNLYQNKEEVLGNIKSESGRIYLKNFLTNQKVIKWLKERNS